MSSLLDILNRTERRDEPTAVAPEGHGDAPLPEPAVELRLAVDNGTSPGPAMMPPETLTDGLALESTVVGRRISHDAPTARDPGPETDPFATFTGAAGNAASDGTRVFSADNIRSRSRRNSVLLGSSLGLIVVAAGAATWLLNEIKVDTSDEGSQFITPGPDSGWTGPEAPAAIERPQPAAAPVVNARPTALQLAAAPARVETGADNDSPDPAWFDTPAVDDEFATLATPAADAIRIVRGTTTNPLFPKLKEAWSAFQGGDYARAENLYREVRAADASNIDALLGLGALAARGGRTDEARDLYKTALRIDPKNPTAISALTTLPAAGTASADESALKNLLREQPAAANLQFALGLLYVGQGRWPDAQVAFFEAVRAEPTNADYAYNLAVSLDRLGQSGPAAAYYQRALELANASTLFNRDAAGARLATLRPTAP